MHSGRESSSMLSHTGWIIELVSGRDEAGAASGDTKLVERAAPAACTLRPPESVVLYRVSISTHAR